MGNNGVTAGCAAAGTVTSDGLLDNLICKNNNQVQGGGVPGVSGIQIGEVTSGTGSGNAIGTTRRITIGVNVQCNDDQTLFGSEGTSALPVTAQWYPIVDYGLLTLSGGTATVTITDEWGNYVRKPATTTDINAVSSVAAIRSSRVGGSGWLYTTGTCLPRSRSP